MRESDIQRACLDYLDAKRIMYLRLNAGDSFRPGANGKLYKVRGAMKGCADLLILASSKESYLTMLDKKTMTCELKEKACPRPIFVEFKAEKGRQSVEQATFEYDVAQLGYEYHIIRDLDELMKVMEG